MAKEKLESKALEMMVAHNLEEIFVTADAQGFTNNQRAVDHTSILKNKEVFQFHKKLIEAKYKVKDTADIIKSDTEREGLFLKYEELYGKKPAHNIGLDKLRSSIDIKTAEQEESEQKESEQEESEQEESEQEESEQE